MGTAIQERQRQQFTQRDRFSTNVDGLNDNLDNHSLDGYINHFDRNYESEHLPQEWYNLNKKVGFSMDTQMNLLKGTDRDSVALWANQTKRDALGFCLEYLSQGLVFPFFYEEVQDRYGKRFIDPKYHKEMIDMVSEKERNGSVRRSVERIHTMFLDPQTPDGTIAVMASPVGPSGLKTDDGEAISYKDSYFFLMVKDGKRIKGCTIKTDFSLQECRDAIFKFSGKELPSNASLETYIEALSFLKPFDNPWEKERVTTEDILQTLQQARTGKDYAFQEEKSGKKRLWAEVKRGIARGEELYTFNERTEKKLTEFTEYVTSKEMHPLELRKALGATMLLLSKLFLFEDKSKPNYHYDVMRERDRYLMQARMTFGDVLSKVEELPGCAGGGTKRKTANDGTGRVGDIDEDSDEEEYSFNTYADCITCGKKTMVGPCNICEPCDKNIRAKNSAKAV